MSVFLPPGGPKDVATSLWTNFLLYAMDGRIKDNEQPSSFSPAVVLLEDGFNNGTKVAKGGKRYRNETNDKMTGQIICKKKNYCYF